MSNLISVSELVASQEDPSLRLIDTRFSLSDSRAGRRAYLQGHLPGAGYFDLEEVLSAPGGPHGGRHPLPDMRAFVEKLGRRGIGNDSRVVVYDDSAGMFAGRLWWMLRYLGHDDVRLLDGGLSAWLEAGQPLEEKLPSYGHQAFIPALRSEMMVDRAYVQRHLGDPDVLLVDARGPARYRGEEEPIDRRAGHIPSAINLPFTDNLIGQRYRPYEELRRRFAHLEDAEEIIVYCGSGVSATHDLLALEEVGIPGAKLYVGSWSDWSSYQDAPIAVGEEP